MTRGRVASDLVGEEFGDWRVIRRSPNNGSYNNAMWTCMCIHPYNELGDEDRICGEIRDVSSQSLLNGSSKGCGLHRGLRDYESIYNIILNQTRHPVSLTYEEFLEYTQEVECHYCGTPIRWSKKNATTSGQRYNLDRKDNSLGYTKDNCVVCCTRCNVGKGRFFTYEQWKQIGEVIRSWGDGDWASRNVRMRRGSKSLNKAFEEIA